MKTALITGASSGLGRGLAVAFAQRGVKVYAAARRADELQQLAKENSTIVPMVLDVSKADDTHDQIKAIDEKDPLDLVIANAGVGGETSAKSLEWTHVKRILDVNVLGAAATLSAVVPGMVARNQGHLVGISSIAAWRGLPRACAYSGSKAMLTTFLESLRMDLQKTNIAVTTISPGFVRTPLNANPKHPVPFILEPDKAIRIMMKAIDKRKAECAFPFPLVAGASLLPLMPRVLYQLIARNM